MSYCKIFRLVPALLMILINSSVLAESNSGMSYSVRVIGGSWTGKNTETGDEFRSTTGSQLGLNVAYQTGRFYTGLNFQGGEYKFEKEAPNQVTSASATVPVYNDIITRSELDLVFGYYLSKHFSMFLDLKSTNSRWESNAYEQQYAGVGIGIAGYWPLGDDWTLHGSFGAILAGEVTHNDEKIADGVSSGLDFGALYSLKGGHRIMFGLKSSAYEYEFTNGDFQRHDVAGIYLGYNYAFSMN